MHITRIVVAPIPTTGWWSCHLIDDDKPWGVISSDLRATKDEAITHAGDLATTFDCPVIISPEED